MGCIGRLADEQIPPVRRRPWWMTAIAAFFALSLLFNALRDLLCPEYGNVEVWLGLEVTGAPARWTAPVHWAMFATGAWAFWTCRSWALPVAAAYAFTVAFSHIVWSETSPNGSGWPIGVLHAAAISIPGFGLLWLDSRRRRQTSPPRPGAEAGAEAEP